MKKKLTELNIDYTPYLKLFELADDEKINFLSLIIEKKFQMQNNAHSIIEMCVVFNWHTVF